MDTDLEASRPPLPEVGARQAMRSQVGRQRTLALFVVAALVFNFPLLALWSHPLQVFGLPLFPLALFVLWGAVIAAVAQLTERSGD
jgi:hypothetical protein